MPRRSFRQIFQMKRTGASTSSTFAFPIQPIPGNGPISRKIIGFTVEYANSRLIDTPVSATTPNTPFAILIREFQGKTDSVYHYAGTGAVASAPIQKCFAAIIDPNGSTNNYRDPTYKFSSRFDTPVNLSTITFEMVQLDATLGTAATLDQVNEFITLIIIFEELIQ